MSVWSSKKKYLEALLLLLEMSVKTMLEISQIYNLGKLTKRSDNEVSTSKFIHTHMCAFKLARRTASLRGRLLWRWGWRDGGWRLSLWDWWSREWRRRRSSPLLLLYLLRDGLVSLGIQIQDLMADIYKTTARLSVLLSLPDDRRNTRRERQEV